jgi:hypothetical protein
MICQGCGKGGGLWELLLKYKSGGEEYGKRITSLYGKQAQVVLAEGTVHVMVPKY